MKKILFLIFGVLIVGIVVFFFLSKNNSSDTVRYKVEIDKDKKSEGVIKIDTLRDKLGEIRSGI